MLLIVQTMLSTFGVAAIGYVFAARKSIHLATLAELAFHITSPALVFHILTQASTLPQNWPLLVLGTLLSAVCVGVVLSHLLRRETQIRRGVTFSGMFWNAGNLGIPCAITAFGEIAAPSAALVFVTTIILQATLGIWLIGGAKSWSAFVKVPLIYACAAGLLVHGMGLQLGPIIATPIEMLANMAIPLMLLNLGIQLRTLRVTHLKPALMASLVRFAVGTTVVWAFTSVLGLTGVSRQVLMLTGALPTAVISIVFAQKYGAGPQAVASTIVVGTLMSLVTIPVMLWFLI